MPNLYPHKKQSNVTFIYSFEEAVEVILQHISPQLLKLFTPQHILMVLELKDEYFDTVASIKYTDAIDDFPMAINEKEMYAFIQVNAAHNQLHIQKNHLNEIFDAELIYFEKNNHLRDAGEWLN